MKKEILLWAFTFCVLFKLTAQNQDVIITPQWLHEHLNDPGLIVLQVNYLKQDFEREHIPGARFLWPDWLIVDAPESSYNLPDLKSVNRALQNLGIEMNSKIVLTHVRNDVALTARLFLTLEQLGLKGRVSFLSGGIEAWKKAGYQTSNVLESYKKGNFKVRLQDIIVDKNYVLQALQSNNALVVDARRKKYYDGDPVGNPRDGHITGAVNIQYTEMFDSTGVFKSDEEMLENFTAVVPSKEKELVAYCFIGQTASVVYLAGRKLGYRIKLYDNSLQEWSYNPDLPMEKTKNDH